MGVAVFFIVWAHCFRGTRPLGWGVPLESIHLVPPDSPLPDEVEAFVGAADALIDRFRTDAGGRYREFVPSDYRVAYRVLRELREQDLGPGRVFVEWGSAFGVVTCLAAMLGFEAYGIEHEEELVVAARELATSADLAATFVCDTYLPSGFDMHTDAIGESRELIRTPLAVRTWEETLGFSIEDVDVVYMYPWPGEGHFVEQLFDAVAAEGALLVTYHEIGEMAVQRRMIEGEVEEDGEPRMDTNRHEDGF
jgi:hypothetical protein